jgi:DNA repair exonuclease SbcCD nuclease subunit
VTTLPVIALAIADIHLSHRPPLARCEEPDWYKAMQRPLNELQALAEKYDVPVLCAGDVFHRWDACPELINFAIDHLPKMYSVPGQHDLPHHSHDDIQKSAYMTLVKAKVLTPLFAHGIQIDFKTGTARVCGFGWKEPVAYPPVHQSLNIAVVHEYTWKKGYGHPEAVRPLEDGFPKKYSEYDVIITGDNHKSFDYIYARRHLFNAGSLMRRASDQIDHKPRVGLIHSDGTVTSHYLDISKDKISKATVEEEIKEHGLGAFLEELKSLNSSSLDFAEVLMRAGEKHGPNVLAILAAALDGGQ